MRKLITALIATVAILLGLLAGTAQASPGAILTGQGHLCNARGICLVLSGGTIVTEPLYKVHGNPAAEWKVWWYGNTSWNTFDLKYTRAQWVGQGHLNKRLVTFQNAAHPDWCAGYLGNGGMIVVPSLCNPVTRFLWIQADGTFYGFHFGSPHPAKPVNPDALTALTSFGPAFTLPYADTPSQKWSVR